MWLCGKESGLEGVEANDLVVVAEEALRLVGRIREYFSVE